MVERAQDQENKVETAMSILRSMEASERDAFFQTLKMAKIEPAPTPSKLEFLIQNRGLGRISK